MIQKKLNKCYTYLLNGELFPIIGAVIRTKFKSLIKKISGFEWQHYYVLSLDCDSLDKSITNNPTDVNIKIATELDWEDRECERELGADKINYIKERCRNNNYSCVIYKKDTVECYGFISYREMEITDNIRFILPDNQAFMYDDYCFIPYRRQGLYKKILSERSRLIKERGYNKILTVVTPANRPSWNGHKNWNKEHSFYLYKIRGKEYCTLTHYDTIK